MAKTSTRYSSKSSKTMRQWLMVLRQQGMDTAVVSRRVRRQAARKLAPYRAEAKAIIVRRAGIADEIS